MPKTSPSLKISVGSHGPSNQMDFPDILRHVIKGKRATKLEWKNPDTFILLTDGFLSLHKAGEDTEDVHALLVSDGDLLGTDWVLLN